MEKKGKLELTWVGKYEEEKLEPRILIEDKSKSYGDPNTENMLIHGDNLLALKALEDKYTGKVKCIYIDPPYNTGEAFDEYDDNVEHSIWLQLMKQRMEILNKLLADDGTIFVQLNDEELCYCRVLMDEVFGRNNFINMIAVKTKNSSGASGGGEDRKLKKNIEHILCYGKQDFKKFYPSYTTVELSQYLEDMKINGVSFKYTMVLTSLGRRKYYKTIKDGAGRDIIIYKHEGYETKSIRQLAVEDEITEIEAFENYYDYVCTTENAQTSIRTRVREATDDLDNLYSIDYYPVSGRNKGKLTTVHFVGKNKRLVSWFKNVCVKERGHIFKKEKVGSLWEDLNWNNVNREGGVVFSGGKKPEILIKRIMELATLPGDIILDSFLGSGTTMAVAHKMNRKWIGIEMGEHAYSLCKTRIDGVIDGEQGGISKEVNWQGGGGYKFYELAEPLLVKNKSLPVYQINPSYTWDMVCEAICKIEGFTYEPSGEFQGHSSENRFIHITEEFVNTKYVMSIMKNLGDKQSLLIYCKKNQADMILPENVEVKKIPKDLLDKCNFESEVQE